ncbi:MAG: hypothetical protein K2W96_10145, partial [Gemmataceae bacterium]|nr:hypothetical protein [Gemmataceae bacterium]
MIILHAGAENGQLWLWAETPAEPVARQAQDAPLPLPYDAGAMRLVHALLGIAAGHALPGGDKPPLLWAPTAKGLPVPSSGLIADVPGEGAALAPWKITALPLPAPLALDLLCGCVGKDNLGQGVLVGSSLAFWAKALQAAGAIVAREQFVPGLRQADGAYRAVWQPVVAGPDSQRVARLARAMPAACRALSF